MQRHITCKSEVRGRGGKHSSPKCQRQRRARTLPFSSPRTVEQPQACSISRRCMATSVNCRGKPPAGAKRILVVAASTLHQSASGRDEHAGGVRLRLASWSSRKLARSVGGAWRRPLQRQTTYMYTCRSEVRGSRRQALCGTVSTVTRTTPEYRWSYRGTASTSLDQLRDTCCLVC